jgi:hypothetical protein
MMKKLILSLGILLSSYMGYTQELKPASYEEDVAKASELLQKYEGDHIAYKHLMFALDVHPKGKEANLLMAKHLKYREHWEDASNYYTEYLNSEPNDTAALAEKGFVMLQLVHKAPNGKNKKTRVYLFDEAKDDYTKLINAGNSKFLLYRGAIYEKSWFYFPAKRIEYLEAGLKDIELYESIYERTEKSIDCRTKLSKALSSQQKQASLK